MLNAGRALALSELRCAFQARKGETYKLAASTKLRSFEELCVVVARP